MKEQFIYGARDTVTGKLVSNLTNPRRKYWDREGNCESAVRYFNKRNTDHPVEVVKFRLVEVPRDE